MKTTLPLALAATSLLAACGGGGSDGSGPTPPAGGASAPASSAAVSGLRVTAQSFGSTTIAWTGNGAAEYRVDRVPLSGGAATRVATTSGTTATDAGLSIKEAYAYRVLACTRTTDPDGACTASTDLPAAVDLGNGLRALVTPQADAAALAADFGMTRVGARWVFADPDDPAQAPTLDYSVRAINGTRVVLTLTGADLADPKTNQGEIGFDGGLGVFWSALRSTADSQVFPYLAAHDYGVVEPLFLAAAAAVGQSWTFRSATSTNCETLAGQGAICDQDVLVTTRVVASTDRFADLCPRSPLAASLPPLKAYRLEQTHVFQARQPGTYKSLPTQARQFWLAPGLGFVAARRSVGAGNTSPVLGTGNHCLIAASGQ